MRLLLINPPISDLNGPYPSIAYLGGYLATIGRPAMLADASLQLIIRLMSAEGVVRLADRTRRLPHLVEHATAMAFLASADWYARTVETAVRCLQGQDNGAALRATRPGYFPPPLDGKKLWARLSFHNQRSHVRTLGWLSDIQRRRLSETDALGFAFGRLGDLDRARYASSLVLDDLAEVVRIAADPAFRLQTYESVLARDVPTFDPLHTRLEGRPTLIDELIDEVADHLWTAYTPDVVGLSVPFGGTLYGALRLVRQLRSRNRKLVAVMGGGFVNTALRQLRDPGLFDYIDFVTLDSGERPLGCLLEHIEGRRPADRLKRTFMRTNGAVRLNDGAAERDVSFDSIGTPTYGELPLRSYLDYSVTLEPRARHWRARSNKLTLAHGCYWKKCTFCDVSLDYIGRYQPGAVDVLMDRIRRLMDETGETGFHFVDEAMPPALLRRLAERLIQDRVAISWWGNVRFDDALGRLAPLLAEAGCVAVTGGVEAASDRLLALMEKGVTLRQVARVTHALASHGVAVHAYLIYGFPSQTLQETVDALEYVRQLFEAGCLHSARWHRFALTAYSPVARSPESFGIRIVERPVQAFANYVLDYEEPGAIDHRRLGPALERAVARFAVSGGDSRPVHEWFSDSTMPPTCHPPDMVTRMVTSD